MAEEHREDEIKSQKRLGVIGFPIGHSRSPLIHNYWLKLAGLDHLYEPMNVEPENVSAFLKKGQFIGLNVTIPHKEAALAACDEVEPFAKRVGAANTLIWRDDGTLYGRNTDGIGFIENLRAGAPDIDFSSGPAAVIGAGGAARAILAALMDAGVPEIRLTNRSIDKAYKLAEEIKQADGADAPIKVLPFEDRAAALTDASLCVNTTSLGMKDNPPLELDLTSLAQGAVVTDIVYSPLETPLLKQAKAQGYTAVDGLGMLLHQAAPAFEAWFGVKPKVTPLLKAMVVEDLNKR
ncbi:MAG: shikimate dehydrogenase [Alphaproteobacteria bacterium]